MSQSPKLSVHHLQVGIGERIIFLLEELSIPYTLHLYQRDPFVAPPSLKAKSPMGTGPVLEDFTFSSSNPLLLTESSAIADYLIHKHADGRLALPPSHPNYTDYLYWFHFSNGSLHPGLMARLGQGPLDSRYAFTVERIEIMFRAIDERVSKNTWLAGEEFTAADVMCVWSFTTARMWIPWDLSKYENILSWMKRCTDRPAYRAAIAKSDPEFVVEELVSAKGPAMFAALAAAQAAGGSK